MECAVQWLFSASANPLERRFWCYLSFASLNQSGWSRLLDWHNRLNKTVVSFYSSLAAGSVLLFAASSFIENADIPAEKNKGAEHGFVFSFCRAWTSCSVSSPVQRCRLFWTIEIVAIHCASSKYCHTLTTGTEEFGEELGWWSQLR